MFLTVFNLKIFVRNPVTVKLLIVTHTDSKLTQLNLDNTIFNYVVADFEKGKSQEEFKKIPLVRDGYVSILSARMTNLSGRYFHVNVSGSIGYVDMALCNNLNSFVHTAETVKNDAEHYVVSDTYENFIQVLHFGGSDYLPDAIEDAYGDAYTDEDGIFKADNINIGFGNSSLSPGIALGVFKLNTIGYLKNEPSIPKGFSEFAVGRIERLDGGEGWAEDEDFVDFEFDYLNNVGTLEVGEVGEGTIASFANSSFSMVNSEKVYGTLSLRNNDNLNAVNINTKAPSLDSLKGSRVILDGSGLVSIDGLNIKIEQLDMNNMPNLKEVAITATSKLLDIKKLHVNYTGEWMANNIPTKGAITKLEIASTSKLVELECYGGQSLKEVNIQGQKLKHIDLHDAGLYKQKWRIGTFEFIPTAPTDSINNLRWAWAANMGTADDNNTSSASGIWGMALSNDYYESFKIYDVTYEHVDSEDKKRCVKSEENPETGKMECVRYETYTVYESDYLWKTEAVKKEDAPGGNKVIDWKTWLPGLAEDDATLVMYGNNINFRYFIGEQSMTYGQAIDKGIIPEPEIIGREYKFRLTNEGWIRNDTSMSEKDSEDFNKLIQSSYFNEQGFSYSTLQNYNVNDFPATNIKNFASDRSRTFKVVYAWSKEALEEKLEDQESFDASRFIELLTKYFTYHPAGYEFSIFNENAKNFESKFRNRTFYSYSDNSIESAYFSLRFGTLPHEMYVREDIGKETNIENSEIGEKYFKYPMMVHKKYKDGWWIFGQDSTGYLSFNKAENANVGSTISSFTIDNDTKVKTIYVSEYGEVEGTSKQQFTRNGNNISVDGILCQYKLFDQKTAFYAHSGTCLIFPFG